MNKKRWRRRTANRRLSRNQTPITIKPQSPSISSYPKLLADRACQRHIRHTAKRFINRSDRDRGQVCDRAIRFAIRRDQVVRGIDGPAPRSLFRRKARSIACREIVIKSVIA